MPHVEGASGGGTTFPASTQPACLQVLDGSQVLEDHRLHPGVVKVLADKQGERLPAGASQHMGSSVIVCMGKPRRVEQ